MFIHLIPIHICMNSYVYAPALLAEGAMFIHPIPVCVCTAVSMHTSPYLQKVHALHLIHIHMHMNSCINAH